MKRIGTFALIAVAMMSVSVVGVATAHKIKVDTSVSAKYNKPAKNDPYATPSFSGTVKASKPRCQKGRTINMQMDTSTGTTIVGTDVTDRNGAWSIEPSSIASGTYFAQATKRVLRKNTKHRHVCKRASSRDVKVK